MKLSQLWQPPKSLWVFFASAIAWFLLVTLLWMQVARWTSYPIASLAHVVFDNSATHWVRAVHNTPGNMEVETRIEVVLPGGKQAGRGSAELVAEADPARYAYGLPLFLALLLAARSRHFFRRAATGYLILLLPQTFSLVFEILRQIVTAGGRPGAMGIDQWQVEAIAMGYQVGSLLLPTLAPVALWLWFDRTFISAVMLDGWLRREAGTAQSPRQG
jgi:hypothetical protein